MKKSKMPKPRIPVAPPGIRHKSAKDYVRNKKVEIGSYNEYDEFHLYDECCGCHACDRFSDAGHALIDFLVKLGIKSAEEGYFTPSKWRF